MKKQGQKILTPEEVKILVIIALASDGDLMEKLVLKGGNAINLVYKIGNRGSNDVDYSIADDFDEEIDDISKKIKASLEKTFAEKGYTVIDFDFKSKPNELSADLVSFWGGYKVEFKILLTEKFNEIGNDSDTLRRSSITLNPNGSPRFEIDISKHEYVASRVEAEIEGYTIYVYGLEMIVAEKLRAICQQDPQYSSIIHVRTQRGRARDFYDIYQILENYQIDIRGEHFKALLISMFDAKRVPLDYINNIVNNKEIHEQDFASLRDTVSDKDLEQNFDFYFEYIIDKFKDY